LIKNDKLRIILIKMKLLTIIKKNFLLLLKSKTSASIIILGPLILVLLAGFSFSSNTQKITIGIDVINTINDDKYSEQINIIDESEDITLQIITKLKEKYDVLEIEKEPCINQLKQNELNVCIFLPNHLIVGKGEEIEFYLDYSKINLAQSIINEMYAITSSQSQEIGFSLTQNLFDKLNSANKNLENPQNLLVKNAKNVQDNVETLNFVKDSLNNLDLSFQKDSFKAEELAKEIHKLRDLAEDAIKQGEKLEIQNNVSGNYSVLNEELNDFDFALIKELNLAILNTESKLKSIKLSKEYVESQIKTIQNNNDDSLKNIKDIENSLDKIRDEVSDIDFKPEDVIIPFKTKINPITPETDYFNYIFPVLVFLMITFTGILLGASLIMVEKKSSAFFRHNMLPANSLIFLLGAYFTGLVILLIQLLFFLITSALLFSINGLNFNIIPGLFFSASFFILLGLLVGLISKNEETSTLISVSISFSFLFFSDIILPLEAMPLFFKKIAMYNPLVTGENLFREVLFHNLVSSKIIILVVYSFLAFIVVWFIYNNKQKI
ncbi:MAG: ABC transporter permease, partial [Candidatus Woesearchaeota archaeon]